MVFSSNLEKLVNELNRNGAKCTLVNSLEQASAAIGSMITERSFKTVAKTRSAPLEPIFCENLKRQGVEVFEVPGAFDSRENLARADMGITGADFGLAESGTIVVSTDTDSERLVSSLPYSHAAIVSSRNIFPSLREAAPHLRKLFLSDSRVPRRRSVTLISGPSRTADIEMVLVRGVHGPNELFVVIVEDLPI